MNADHAETIGDTTRSASSILTRLETFIDHAVEVPVALLTAVEIAILLAGVIARYVFRSPFTWSDELASILFLWLAMLGTVVAFRRGEHMRMSVLVNSVGRRWKAFFEAFSIALAIAFLLLILWPAVEYASDEVLIVTPALEIPNVWRAAAVPVGCALMLIVAALRLARAGR